MLSGPNKDETAVHSCCCQRMCRPRSIPQSFFFGAGLLLNFRLKGAGRLGGLFHILFFLLMMFPHFILDCRQDALNNKIVRQSWSSVIYFGESNKPGFPPIPPRQKALLTFVEFAWVSGTFSVLPRGANPSLNAPRSLFTCRCWEDCLDFWITHSPTLRLVYVAGVRKGKG